MQKSWALDVPSILLATALCNAVPPAPRNGMAQAPVQPRQQVSLPSLLLTVFSSQEANPQDRSGTLWILYLPSDL